MAAVGRRPGNPGTRGQIVDAARAEFLEAGYERASIRSIARRAGVDPALVHHYFGGKPALFVELVGLGRDPRQIQEEAAAPGSEGQGARIVRGFLGAWETGDDAGSNRFVTAMQAVCSSPQAAVALREFLTERVWAHNAVAPGPDADIRRALVGSTLVGMGWQRYVLRAEPLASASVDEVAGWVGPAIDRYLEGPLS